MRKIVLLFAIFHILEINAQNYLITFEGTGASTSVSSVKVENLTSGTSLTLNGSDVLRLTTTTGINAIEDNQSYGLKIYPNPMDEKTKFEFCPPVAGDAIIAVYDMTGKPVAQIQSYLENSRHDFSLSGLENGFYLLNVKGDNYLLSGKLVSNGKSSGKISIEKVDNVTQSFDKKTVQTNSKGAQATVDMVYTSGDRLKFTGISGDYRTVKTGVITSDETISFNFFSCTDGDNNTYPVVEIGDQVWMAENLKTTKFNDGISIPLVTDNIAWSNLTTPGYCWYNNDPATYKNIYGALYIWYSVNTGKLCPIGWHMPTNPESAALERYLIANNYNFDGTIIGNKIAKAMASTANWAFASYQGMVGNNDYPSYRNKSGFTALPGGYRNYDGTFSSVGTNGYWWTITEFSPRETWYWTIAYNVTSVNSLYVIKEFGISIRCIKDI